MSRIFAIECKLSEIIHVKYGNFVPVRGRLFSVCKSGNETIFIEIE